jgi:hypothetical protein
MINKLRDQRIMQAAIVRRMKFYRLKNNEQLARVGNLRTKVVNVPNTDNTIYVTLQLSGIVEEAVNHGPNAIFDTPVIVGYEPEAPNRLVVLRAWNAYGKAETPSDGVKNHHKQHQWRTGTKQGSDILYVWGEQIMPSLYFPSGLNVIIWPGNYRTSTGWVRKTSRHTVDMTTHVPGTSNKARIALIVVNSAGAFAVRDGALVTGWDNLTDADIPEPNDGDNVICAVKLFYGQTAIRMSSVINDFIDLRWTGANGGGTAPIPTHGSTHISTGDDPVPDVVSGGASGLMTGADKAKLDTIDPYPLFMVSENLTSQITGATAHFTHAVPTTGHDNVYCGLRQLPGDVTMDSTGLGFTLSYTPTISDTLIVDRHVTTDRIVTFGGSYLMFAGEYLLY